MAGGGVHADVREDDRHVAFVRVDVDLDGSGCLARPSVPWKVDDVLIGLGGQNEGGAVVERRSLVAGVVVDRVTRAVEDLTRVGPSVVVPDLPTGRKFGGDGRAGRGPASERRAVEAEPLLR